LTRIFVTRRWPGSALDELTAAGYDVEVWPDFGPPRWEEIAERAKGVHALITTVEERVDGALLDRIGSQLQVIAQAGVGYDNVDVPAAAERGVVVTNAPDVLTDATADLAFALLAAVARRVAAGFDHVREGRWTNWHPALLLGPELYGATVGVVGFGRIGQTFAKRCLGFDMELLYASPTEKDEAAALGAKRVSLEKLLRSCDFVSLHIPLTSATIRLMGREHLALMRHDAVLVNTARGAVVDTDALTAGLAEGRLGGAGLDVTDPEPLPADHPLLSLPNVIVTPHIGSAGRHTREAMIRLAMRNCLAVLAGDGPLTPVAP
jgi:glyoxylate reductase